MNSSEDVNMSYEEKVKKTFEKVIKKAKNSGYIKSSRVVEIAEELNLLYTDINVFIETLYRENVKFINDYVKPDYSSLYVENIDDEKIIFKSDKEWINKYLEELRKIPVLSEEEDLVLAKRCAKQDEEARKELALSKLMLVFGMSLGYANKRYSLSEILYDANDAAIRAVDNYNYKWGISFTTYLILCVKSEIICRVNDLSRRIIRFSPLGIGEVAKIGAVFRKLEKSDGTPPTAKEIADVLNLPVGEVERVIMNFERIDDN